jgi:hypothetical protein
MESWIIGLLDYWIVGLLDCWATKLVLPAERGQRPAEADGGVGCTWLKIILCTGKRNAGELELWIHG